MLCRRTRPWRSATSDRLSGRSRTAVTAVALCLGVLASPALADTAPARPVAPTAARGPLALVVAAASATAAGEPGAGDPADGAELGRRVSAALSAAGVTTVAAAVDVAGYDRVLRRDASHALPPASTQKSYTGLSALVALGSAARLRTEVAATATVGQGQLPGSVWLVAGGDPYLTMTGLRALARSVRSAGITSIAGDVRLDDTRFDARRSASGWKSAFVPGQSGPLSALAVDGNRWRSDRAFLADPALPAAVRFRDYLRAEGVTVAGTVRRASRPVEAVTVAERVSGPIPLVVRRALKASDNFAAELLLKELGRVVEGEGSSAAGVVATRKVLGRLGVPVGVGADGSGLSAQDRQSPAGQLALLRAADGSGSGEQFRAALPVGCRDGTLRRRFCGTAAEGRVQAKTGTLNGVRALAGYTRTASGRDVWFAFQLTGVKDGAKALAAMDRAVVLLSSATA